MKMHDVRFFLTDTHLVHIFDPETHTVRLTQGFIPEYLAFVVWRNPAVGPTDRHSAWERNRVMLSQVYIGREVVRPSQTDLHRHATFSCAWGRLKRRIASWFGL